MKKRLILAVTGASGMPYLVEFLKLVHDQDIEIHAVVSDAGRQVMRLETGLAAADLSGYITGSHGGLPALTKDENCTKFTVPTNNFCLKWYDMRDFTAPMASGSSKFSSMLVLPCTMGTLAAIANGISGNLIHRAADVTLKERRPLLLAVRETPLNRTHLENMLKAHKAGAIICPPMPAFYQNPGNLAAMAKNFAGRLCDLLDIHIPGIARWDEIREQ